jgi:hypothetical protein
MKSEKYSQYHYRENADGTIDSICLRCYLSAGSARNETELHAFETAHRCGGKPAGANMGLSEEGYMSSVCPDCRCVPCICNAPFRKDPSEPEPEEEGSESEETD